MDLYLDANATHPLLPSVRAGLIAALSQDSDELANPSSIHQRGQKARAELARLRDTLCVTLGRADGDEMVITSGATESLNLAIRGFVRSRLEADRSVVLVSSSVEHSAVKETIADVVDQARQTGATAGHSRVSSVVVDVAQDGSLKSEALTAALSAALENDNTDVLLVLQVANNETGARFELEDILKQIHLRWGAKLQKEFRSLKEVGQRIWVLLDAAQALGKVDEAELRRICYFADYVAVSGHKIGAPAGVGALWIRPSAPFVSSMTGGSQERRRRGGTHNSLGILGFRIALEDWLSLGERYRAQMARNREILLAGLAEISGVKIHGKTSRMLPNTVNFYIEGMPEESLLLSLDLDRVFLSSGSACNSGTLKPSPVLLAMGFGPEESGSSIRVSLSAQTEELDLLFFLERLKVLVERIDQSRKKSREIFPDFSSHDKVVRRDFIHGNGDSR